jgi:para-nitrobenzyl esterase
VRPVSEIGQETAYSPVVTVAQGSLRGTRRDGICCFKGIRYAAPPIGPRRFLAPAPAEEWTGTLDCVEFGRTAPQVTLHELFESMPMDEEQKKVLDQVAPLPHDEDCLALNIWSADLTPSAKRPVVIWLHSGAWTGNCSHGPFSDGTSLAASGVVYVSVGHRLGALGFLALGHLLGERYAQSSNAGVLDMIAALEWVKENISNFGGDPENVTLVGESGIGNKVFALMATPRANGLFHRAWAMGGPLLRLVEAEQAADFADRIVKYVGVSPDELVDLPFERLIEAQLAVVPGPIGGPPVLGPTLDGDLYPAHPFHPTMADTVVDVPLVCGVSAQEGGGTLPSQGDDNADPALSEAMRTMQQEVVRGMVGPAADSLEEGYRRLHPESGGDLTWVLGNIMTDLMRVPMLRLAERKADRGTSPTFVYELAYPTNGERGAAHGAIIAFILGNIADIPSSSQLGSDLVDRHQEMSKILVDALLAFAHTGDPNSPQLPRWPAYSVSRDTMILDLPSTVEPDPFAANLELWDDVDASGWGDRS